MLQTSIKSWQRIPEAAALLHSAVSQCGQTLPGVSRLLPLVFHRFWGFRLRQGVASPRRGPDVSLNTRPWCLQNNLIFTHARWGYATVADQSNAAQQFLMNIVGGDVQNCAERRVSWKRCVISSPTSRAATCSAFVLFELTDSALLNSCKAFQCEV